MKRIYFVRHGETNGNVGGYWQGPQEPLNVRGLQQADVVAERAKGLYLGCPEFELRPGCSPESRLGQKLI